MDQIPTSTQWTRDAVGEAGRQAVDSVYLIHGQKTNSQGTGFLLDNGTIITNQHVIDGNNKSDLTVISAYDQEYSIVDTTIDVHRDLAALEPEDDLTDGLRLQLSDSIKPGAQVSTWGYPIGYSGPAPLLSVGYLAGFQQERTPQGPVKQLVVNGAFNNGNSGGPLFVSGERRVVGVVVAKHVPLTESQKWILEFLQEEAQVVNFTFEQEDGSEERVSLSELVSDYLEQYHQLTQLMIGHAIDAEELSDFLEENDYSVPKQ